MRNTELRRLRAELDPYTNRSTVRGTCLLVSDLLLWLGFTAGTLYFDSIWLKVLCAIGAGTAIASLFVLGHDLVHGSLMKSDLLNKIWGRVAFMPALHNYNLWVVVHNKLHHPFPNFKNRNSWSPLDKNEFEALPGWRKVLYRLYRTPLGFGPYYITNRWWADKFFPRKSVVKRHKLKYWLDFGLLVAFAAVLVSVLYQYGGWQGVFFGYGLPYLIWNYLIGFTVYGQHTHPEVSWFKDANQWQKLQGQEDVTIWVRFPRWFGLLFHDVMDHTAHHIYPVIPVYRLHAAQKHLAELVGDRQIQWHFSILRLWNIMKSCKIYDYEMHVWRDFKGNQTSAITLRDDFIQDMDFTRSRPAAAAEEEAAG